MHLFLMASPSRQVVAATLSSLQSVGATHIVNLVEEDVPCHFRDQFSYLAMSVSDDCAQDIAYAVVA